MNPMKNKIIEHMPQKIKKNKYYKVAAIAIMEFDAQNYR